MAGCDRLGRMVSRTAVNEPMTEPGAHPLRLAERAAQVLVERLGARPEVAIVLGSGWGSSLEKLGSIEVELASSELPGFVQGTVQGHEGVLRTTRVGRHSVLCLSGRVHLYEQQPAAAVVHPVRTAVLAGCHTVILTNAAGAIRPDFQIGKPVLISDHLNFTGTSPLVGPVPSSAYRDRFLDLSHLYDPGLRGLAKQVEPGIREGVYVGVLGPQYETPAEILMFRRLGADLVGMSTVLEAIAARHLGAQVMGVSLVTNFAAGLAPSPLDGQEVLEIGRGSAPALGRLLAEILGRL